jgi:hypothetical protein
MSRHQRKHENRLRRQFDALARTSPASRSVVHALLHGRMRMIRLPLAVFLILGSFLAILPVFGLWMLPAGLMLLALDVPLLRPRVSATLIRLRRRWAVRRHKKRGAPVPPAAAPAD